MTISQTSLFISNLHLKHFETWPKKTQVFPDQIMPSSCLYSSLSKDLRCQGNSHYRNQQNNQPFQKLQQAAHQQPSGSSNPSRGSGCVSVATVSIPPKHPRKADIKPLVKSRAKWASSRNKYEGTVACSCWEALLIMCAYNVKREKNQLL